MTTTPTAPTLDEAIATGNYFASTKAFEPTIPARCGQTIVVRLTPYLPPIRHGWWQRDTIYGETVEFRFDHPDFRDMLRVARRVRGGLRVEEVALADHNLAEFCQVVMSNPYSEEPHREIRNAMKIIERK